MTNTESTPIHVTPPRLETWPLANDAPWRVIAWPNWRGGPDLQWIFEEFGAALAEKDACLCLRHDPAMDGRIQNAKNRLSDIVKRTGLADRHQRIAIIDGPLSDVDWETISSSMDAKIPSAVSPKSPRRTRIESLRALELRTTADVARLLVDEPLIKPLDTYRKLFADVPGWFLLPAIDVWDSLLSFQSESNVSGNFLEIGVWMGRSALLSTLHASDGEECVYVDPLPIDEAKASLQSVRETGLHFVQATSRNLTPAMLPGFPVPSYRWIHIDGEHSGVAVEHDLTLASNLLGPRGIIVLDDFFDHSYPQITFALVEHLRAHPKSLMMFLSGFGKAYLCHPSDGRWLLKYVAERLPTDLAERGAPPFTLFKTADPLDLNAFGIGPRDVDEVFRGPDWKTDLLQY